jgi:hypothetical protein
MLGYISSTRKKSCFACVKSKRRCDLGYPYCKRCCLKGYDCKYPNATKRETASNSGHVPTEVIIRHATPDLAPIPSASTSAETTFVNFSTADANIDPSLLQASDSSGSSSSPESFDHFDQFQIHNDGGMEEPHAMTRPMLTRMWVPEVVVPSFLSKAQTQFVIRHLSGFVPAMAHAGATLYLHKDLYPSSEPEAYQDCVALSALYLNKTPQNQRILARSISSKIASMIAEVPIWSLNQHLAAVQALIIYQIIRLFDPDLRLQEQAEEHNALLKSWAAQLWKRVFIENPSFTSDYSSWVFHESLRRTIMVSVTLRCVWSCLTRDGYADLVPVLARLPVTRDHKAWHYAPEEWNNRPLSSLRDEEMLVSYGEMSQTWSREDKVNGMDPFEQMLLAACRGKDDPRLLVG